MVAPTVCPEKDQRIGTARRNVGRGGAKFSLNEMPRYVEMLDFACRRLDWTLDEFRGFRCIVQYPMHGSQAAMMFDAPPRPPG